MSKRWNQPGKSGNVNVNPGFKSYLDNEVVRGDLNKKSDKGTMIYYSGEKKNISKLHLTSNTDGTGAHWSGKDVSSKKGHASFSSNSIGKGHEWANNAQKAYHQGEILGKAAKEAASKAASKEAARKATKEAASKAKKKI